MKYLYPFRCRAFCYSVGFSLKAMAEQKTFEYANLYFSGFDKEKDVYYFKVGQVFVGYQTLNS